MGVAIFLVTLVFGLAVAVPMNSYDVLNSGCALAREGPGFGGSGNNSGVPSDFRDHVNRRTSPDGSCYTFNCLNVQVSSRWFAQVRPSGIGQSHVILKAQYPRQIARNNILEQTILDLLEDLRETMVNGSDDVPVLDPLAVEEFNLDLDALGLENSHVAVKNAVVNQLSTFVVNDLRLTSVSVFPIQRYNLVLDFSIPELEAEAGTYDLSVSAMGFTLFGSGHMKVRIIEPRIQATVLLRVRALPPPITFIIENADVVFKLTGFESEMSGMLGGDQMANDFISLFLKDLVPQLVEFYEAEISNVINQLVLEIGNEILGDLDLGGILG